jgi:tetratricopeptide (TPR) repeat protein
MKSLKFLLIIVIPIALMTGLFILDPLYGGIGVFLILAYAIYRGRGTIIFYSASKKAIKKDFEGAAKKIRAGYDKKLLSPFQETFFAFLLLKRFGEAGEAEDITQKVLDRPKLPERDRNFAKLTLSMIYYFNGEIDRAMETVSDLSKDYKTGTMYGIYGCCAIAKGDLAEALRINLEAYKFDRNNHVILDNLGQTYIMLGQFDKAAEIYRDLMARKPSFPEAFYNNALVREHEGDLDEAIYQMKISLQKDFTYLTTIDAEEIVKKIEKLYIERDKLKGGAQE